MATVDNDKPSDLQSMTNAYVLTSCDGIISCMSVDSKYAHIAMMSGNIKMFDLETKQTVREFTLRDADHSHIPSNMRFLNKKYEKLITSDLNGNVCCWCLSASDLTNEPPQCIRKWKTHKSFIPAFEITSNFELIFSIGFDGYLRVRNLAYNGNVIHSVQYGTVALTSLALISDHSALIGTENGVIMHIDIRKEKVCNMFEMAYATPIRSICLDPEHSHCYFSFDVYSIGVLDVSNGSEWKYIGKFVEGLEHHQSTVNALYLRNECLWSCSEDNCIRIWDLDFLRANLEKNGKKKSKANETMPNCIKLADSDILSSTHFNSNSVDSHLLEVWCLLQLKGAHLNGIQRLYFTDTTVISLAYEKDVIAFDLEGIDNTLQSKKQEIVERRKQLNDHEKELQAQQQKDSEVSTSKKKDSKNDKKGKKKK